MNFITFFNTVFKTRCKPAQLILVMKLTAILLLVSLCQVSAGVYSQNITLKQRNVPIDVIFKSIEKQSAYVFLYDNLELQNIQKISIDVKNTPIDQVLDLCFKNQPLSYKIFDKTIVLRKKTIEPIYKSIFETISGKVTDETGQPIVGASILVKGTKIGATTDANGAFSLTASAGSTLVISYIGYISREININDSKNYTIILQPASTELTDVVVTALGIKRSEKSLGYAVQKVAGKDLQTVKGVDVATSLTGRVSGLVIKNSTEFNARPTIELRGENALLVIDGVPYGNLSLRDIPTDDIESMDILKGPTASALYGSRASGGVLLITTKKGAAGKGLSIDVNSNTMTSLGFLAIPEVQSAYGRGQNGVIDNDYVWGPKLDAGIRARDWNPVTKQFEDNMLLESKGKDNLKNFMSNGLILNNNLSIAQSGENGSFRIGLNDIYNKGQFPNQNLNMVNLTMSGEMKLSDKFKLEGHMGISRRWADQVWGGGYNNQGYLYQLVMWTGTEYDIRDYQDYWKVPNKTQNWIYTNWYDNPYLIAYEKLNGIQTNTMNANVTATYQISNDFNLLVRLGYDNYNNKTTFRNPTANIFSTRGGAVNGSGWDAKGMYSIDDSKGFSTNDDVILSYKKKLNKFSIDALAGGTVYYYIDESLKGTTKNGLISPTFYSLAGSVEPPTVSQTYGTRQINSLYGRASVGYNDAIFIDFTGRNDWNSAQPKESRSYFYPSIGSSIVVSELVKLPKVIDMFKIRGSWAVFKTALGVYANNRTYSTTTAAWNTLNSASYPASLLGNSLLPSSQRTYEIGAAGYLFKKRLHFDVAYFNKYYYDQQVSTAIPASSGFTSTLVNTQETYERRGLEITVDGSVIRNKNFEWYSTINWSNQHRYYVNLDPVYSADNLWVKKGERLDTYTDNYWVKDPEGNVIHESGYPVWSDYVKKLGYGDPDFSFGFINNFNYKNWSLGLNIDGRIGGLMYNYIYDKMFDSGTAPETDNIYRYNQVVLGKNDYVGQGVKVISGSVTYDRYGQITSDTRKYAINDVPIGYQDYAQWYRGGDNRVQNESFIKLREISLGYRLTSKTATKLGLKSASFSLTGQNLFMWTNFKYSDPDVDTENLNSPSMRMVGFNIKVGF
ncbi:SusC/RagA family TonB-linked outer membrane protein [Pedobacter kyonggii]|uniref:SusC/RagA family TonB-linked outer membrane protein n=1 Tax=Pedobacter kyonggii TaxID=1926871 RepID=A0A4V2JGE4_9SPHI|nr:SusC/RagA family TonB-linked outer membrane protein [Pedobacter kyonggii]TBO40024.1 SusC/RagA family TonB-linked outer membrane protein [Pedobacter kyonggii]